MYTPCVPKTETTVRSWRILEGLRSIALSSSSWNRILDDKDDTIVLKAGLEVVSSARLHESCEGNPETRFWVAS